MKMPFLPFLAALAALAAGPLAAQVPQVARQLDRPGETFALDPQWTNDSGARFGKLLFRAGGIELTNDVSFRSAGFFESHGEVALGLGVGARLAALEVRLRGALGVESGGGDGKILDAEAFAGRTFGRTQIGLLASLRMVAEEDEGLAASSAGRDYELYAGPVSAISLPGGMLLQGRLGLVQPRRSDQTTAGGMVSAIWGF